jgi:hypothetical protein
VEIHLLKPRDPPASKHLTARKFPTSFEGIRADGDGTQTYLFMSWLLAPVASEDVPPEVDPGKWLDNSFTTIALPLNINIHLRHRPNLGQHMY